MICINRYASTDCNRVLHAFTRDKRVLSTDHPPRACTNCGVDINEDTLRNDKKLA